MEWWMWFILITWPFAGASAYEYMVWYDKSIPSVPRLTGQEHVVKLILSVLAGWLLVVYVILAGGCDGDEV